MGIYMIGVYFSVCFIINFNWIFYMFIQIMLVLFKNSRESVSDMRKGKPDEI